MKTTICRECKWDGQYPGTPSLDRCRKDFEYDYVTGRKVYNMHCDRKNTRGECKDFEIKPPFWSKFFK